MGDFHIQMDFSRITGIGSDHAICHEALNEYYHALLVMKWHFKKITPTPECIVSLIPKTMVYPFAKPLRMPLFSGRTIPAIREYGSAVARVFPGFTQLWTAEDDEKLKTAGDLWWRFNRVYDYPIAKQEISMRLNASWDTGGKLSELAVLQEALEWMVLKNAARQILFEEKKVKQK